VSWWENLRRRVLFAAGGETKAVPAATGYVFSATAPTVNLSSTARAVCASWSRAGCAPESREGHATTGFDLTNHASVAFGWQTQFWLSVLEPGHGALDVGDGWIEANETVDVTATPNAYWHFVCWTGCTESTSNPLSLRMTSPLALGAVFGMNLATNGVPEQWLADHGWTNDFSAAAVSDTDHDGHQAWQEYLANTNPTNAA
jgi:hypothetical protein